jgi:TonB family protein
MNNLALWSLQTIAIVAVAALAARAMKAAHPMARLVLWQLTLLACLLLPVVRPWQSEVVTAVQMGPRIDTAPAAGNAVRSASAFAMPTLTEASAFLLAAGIAIRFAVLAVGMFRLRKYRRDARCFAADACWQAEAQLLISEAVPSPVTFGLLHPVILLPSHFEALDARLRDTILYHEILHVRRRDWLFAVAEEAIRGLLWFHPAIWWTIREIQLAREEVVDKEVVETMNAREAYVDALLAIAASPLGSHMTPAPFGSSFMRRRKHLKHRVVSLFREVNMSKAKSVSALIAGVCALALSCWYVTGALPLQAAPQEVVDGPGVTVDTGGVRLLHRSSVSYSTELRSREIQGTVVVQVRTDANGSVVDASVTSGPDELRKTVLQSVLGWHFAHDSANTTRQVAVTFSLPKSAAPAVEPAQQPLQVITRNSQGATSMMRMGAPNPMLPISGIKVIGLADDQRDELLSRLPLRVGDTPTVQTFSEFMKAVHAFDEHLTVVTAHQEGVSEQEITIRLTPAGPLAPPPPLPPPPPAAELTAPAGTIKIGPNVAAGNLVTKVEPVYPELAKAARVQGTVRFQAVIGPDGLVQNLHLLLGPPLLVQAAMQAVQQWVYKPVLLNGQPVSVTTTIDVDFTLAQ